MLQLRVSALAILLTLVVNNTVAGGCGAKQMEPAQNAGQTERGEQGATPEPIRKGADMSSGDLQVLQEGRYTSFNQPFVALARDPQTYAALREMVSQLPELEADFFRSHAVIAAFLGQRRTGGYSVEITREANGPVQVGEKSPSKGLVVTQALTAPFKVAALPVAAGQSLQLTLDNSWQTAMRPYRVTTAEINLSGGVAGRTERLPLEGEIRIMRAGKLATFVFAVKSGGQSPVHTLNEITTGIVETDGRISIPLLDADSLVERPHSALKATGQFTDNENKLSLAFTSLPSKISDGFSGAGKLDAVATAPPPRRPVREDEPM